MLSGSDLPLASQDEIHQFFAEHQGAEFLTFSGVGNYDKIYQRVKYDYHFPKLTARYTNNRFITKCIQVFRKLDLNLQQKSGVDIWYKINGNLDLKYGSNWFSITEPFAKYIIQNKKWIEESFKKSYLCDELFIHTLIYHSPFYKNIYDKSLVHDFPEEFQGNLRYINWWDGSPYTWDINKKEDCEQLKIAAKRGHLFARKFDLSPADIQSIKNKERGH